MKNVNLLIDSIKKMLEDQEDDDALEEAIGKLVLRDMLDEQQEESANDRAQLMTLHAAKGLEFPFVYLMGAEEGMLPHQNSIDSDNIEEERRLFYVGVTRAKQNLSITMAANRKLYGNNIRTTPSRFIEEIPAEHIIRQGFESQTQEEAEQKGSDARASLKAMFG